MSTYNSLKRLAKGMIPRKVLRGYEFQFRQLYVRFFVKEGDHICSVCGSKMREFIKGDKGELICPSCGSGKRHRQLVQLLSREPQVMKGNILDFSPNPGFAFYARQNWGDRYRTTDFQDSDNTDFQFDIRDIKADDKSFSVIICYHVLEHIVEDQQAMKELYRILKPGGVCYIQTPFKEGEIYEDFSITTPEGRLKAFEQEDHVRIYSVTGLKGRLEKAGFKTKVLHFKKEDRPEETEKFGFKDEEFILLARK